MRILTDTMLAAQKSSTIDALLWLQLTKVASTTYNYYRDRILDVRQTQQPYSYKTIVVLDNSDGVLTSIDLRGYQGQLGWGFHTSAGDEYLSDVPMKIVSQKLDSAPGVLSCTLELASVFDLMAEDRASVTYAPADTNTDTVKTIINAIAGATLACFNHCTAYSVDWDSEDSLINTYTPKSSFRIYLNGSRLAAIKRLLEYTGCVMRMGNDGHIHIFVPTTTGTTYDYEYSLASGYHTFFAKAYRKRLVIPNYVWIGSLPDASPSYSGYAEDTVSSALLPKREFHQMYLTSNAQATAVATARLLHYQLQAEGGAGDVPMNVGAEVYDYVKITDARQGDSVTGNIGSLTRYWNAKKGVWRMTFSFGGWASVRDLLNELAAEGQYFERLQVKDLYAENIKGVSLDFTSFDLNDIANGADPPPAVNYARVKSLHLDSGQIKIDDQVQYSSGYNPKTKARTFTAEPVPPYYVGDWWIQVDVSASIFKRCTTERTSGVYVAGDWTVVSLDGELNGTNYARVKSSSLTAEGLVILDKVDLTVGETQYGLLLASQVSAGKINLTSTAVFATGYNPSKKRQVFTTTPVGPYDIGDLWLEAGIAKRCNTARATADYLASEWTAITQDDVETGTTYGRLKTTYIEGGVLKLTTGVLASGQWYSYSDITIDAGVGITMTGEQDLIFTNGGATSYIYASSATGNLTLYAGTSGKNVELSSNGGVIRLHDNLMNLGQAYLIDMGDATDYFDDIYCNNLHYHGALIPFDAYDDIALIKQIKTKVVNGVEVIDISSVPSVLKRKKVDVVTRKIPAFQLRKEYRRQQLQALLEATPENRPIKRQRIQEQLDSLDSAVVAQAQQYEAKLKVDKDGYLEELSAPGLTMLLLGAIKQIDTRLEKLEKPK